MQLKEFSWKTTVFSRENWSLRCVFFSTKWGWLAKNVHFSRTLNEHKTRLAGDWQFNSIRAFYMGLTQSSFPSGSGYRVKTIFCSPTFFLFFKLDKNSQSYCMGYQSCHFFGSGDFSTCSPTYFLPSSKVLWAFKSKKLLASGYFFLIFLEDLCQNWKTKKNFKIIKN